MSTATTTFNPTAPRSGSTIGEIIIKILKALDKALASSADGARGF